MAKRPKKRRGPDRKKKDPERAPFTEEQTELLREIQSIKNFEGPHVSREDVERSLGHERAFNQFEKKPVSDIKFEVRKLILKRQELADEIRLYPLPRKTAALSKNTGKLEGLHNVLKRRQMQARAVEGQLETKELEEKNEKLIGVITRLITGIELALESRHGG